MRFLVDAQLPPALARWLASRGHEAEHVGDCGLLSAADAAIWDHALRTGSVLVTKDEDFAQRKSLRGDGHRWCGSGCQTPVATHFWFTWDWFCRPFWRRWNEARPSSRLFSAGSAHPHLVAHAPTPWPG
jgi:hypothetical protein